MSIRVSHKEGGTGVDRDGLVKVSASASAQKVSVSVSAMAPSIMRLDLEVVFRPRAFLASGLVRRREWSGDKVLGMKGALFLD